MAVHQELNYRDRTSWMAVRQETDVELVGELEAIATAATDRMRALSDGDVERETDLRRRVGGSEPRNRS